MVKRTTIAAIFLAAVLVVTAGSAYAAGGQTSGLGKTKLNASFGFNIQADLSGSAQYGGTLAIHCNDYTSYRDGMSPNGLWKKSWANSDTCFDGDGTRYIGHFEFVDRGEGANDPEDRACIIFKLHPAEPGPEDRVIFDCFNVIKNGNVQILPN